MELLVVLLVEVLFSFAVVVISAVGGFAAVAIAAIASLISSLVGRSRKQAEKPTSSDGQIEGDGPTVTAMSAGPDVFKWIKRVSGFVFVAIVASLIAINFLFLKPVGNWALAKLEQRTGIEVVASGISGNLFTGTFRLTDLTAKRVSDEKSNFDLKVAEISGGLVVNSLIFGPPMFESLSVTGVSGRFDFKKRDKGRKTGKIKTRRNFIVGHMMISDADIQLYNPREEALNLSLASAVSRPLRSNYAVFDLFFRSNISGSLAGRKLEIKSSGTQDGRSTTWKIDQLPVSVLSHFSDAPVISWLDEGTIDIDVEDNWKLSDRAKIDMDWHLLAHDVKMRVPADAKLLQKTIFIPVQKYLDRRGKPVDVSFSLVMNEKQFEGAASLEAANLWATVKDGFIKALVSNYRSPDKSVEQNNEAPDDQEEEMRGRVDRTIDSLKGFLDKRRKVPDPDN